jgi:ribonuclease VapC
VIVLDSSALMAILVDEPEGERCHRAIEAAAEVLMSSVTLSEVLIVADQRGVGDEMRRLIDLVRPKIVALDAPGAHRVAEAYRRWGKGRAPAKLNFGDCHAYALASSRNCPLLFVGDDFSLTDIRSALAS